MNEFVVKDIIKMQKEYESAVKNKKLTKMKLIEICKPFKDKYKITDSETITIARNGMCLNDMAILFSGNKNNEIYRMEYNDVKNN